MEIKTFVVGPIETNCYVVYGGDGKNCFVVDPGEADKDLLSFLDKEALNPQYIVLTHGHGDHVSGIPTFKKKYPDIKIIANKAERKILFNRDMGFGPGGITADIEITDGEEMDICGAHLKFITTPGHTPGGMCILMDKTLFCGDTLFWGSVGRTDLPGGNAAELMSSIRDKLFLLPDDIKCLPGHMEPTTIGFERQCNPFA